MLLFRFAAALSLATVSFSSPEPSTSGNGYVWFNVQTLQGNSILQRRQDVVSTTTLDGGLSYVVNCKSLPIRVNWENAYSQFKSLLEATLNPKQFSLTRVRLNFGFTQFVRQLRTPPTRHCAWLFHSTILPHPRHLRSSTRFFQYYMGINPARPAPTTPMISNLEKLVSRLNNSAMQRAPSIWLWEFLVLGCTILRLIFQL